MSTWPSIIMKKLTTVICLLLLSVSGFSQWHWQNPKPQGNPLRSLYFLDASNGYAAGDLGTIIKTTNEGQPGQHRFPDSHVG